MNSECERIELAGLLADRFDAMLIGMSAMDLRPPVVVDDVVVDGAEMQSEIKTIKAVPAEKGNWFRSIAGAYGHSRLGEWVFGGITRELLAKSPICCLLSH